MFGYLKRLFARKPAAAPVPETRAYYGARHGGKRLSVESMCTQPLGDLLRPSRTVLGPIKPAEQSDEKKREDAEFLRNLANRYDRGEAGPALYVQQFGRATRPAPSATPAPSPRPYGDDMLDPSNPLSLLSPLNPASPLHYTPPAPAYEAPAPAPTPSYDCPAPSPVYDPSPACSPPSFDFGSPSPSPDPGGW
jgi:hypothetical protein